jgi:hypothetical protein
MTPPKWAGQQMLFDAAIKPPAELTSRLLIRAHRRFDTSTPPVAPPLLCCPNCDQPLQYVSSHIGGVNARFSEQWDYYACHNGCATFEYRQRTRRLRRVQ